LLFRFHTPDGSATTQPILRGLRRPLMPLSALVPMSGRRDVAALQALRTDPHSADNSTTQRDVTTLSASTVGTTTAWLSLPGVPTRV